MYPARPRRNWILNRIYQSGPTRLPRRSTRHTPIFDPCQKLRGRFTHGFRRVVKLGEQPSLSLFLFVLYSSFPLCFSLFRLHCLRLSAEFFSLSLYLTIFLVSDGVRGSPLFVGWVNCAPVFLSQKWKIYCYIGFLNGFVQYCKNLCY